MADICDFVGELRKSHLHVNHTAKNATDLMQVVDFTGLMLFTNKLCQAC
jgi:hypothetical protein